MTKLISCSVLDLNPITDQADFEQRVHDNAAATFKSLQSYMRDGEMNCLLCNHVLDVGDPKIKMMVTATDLTEWNGAAICRQCIEADPHDWETKAGKAFRAELDKDEDDDQSHP